MHGQPHVRFTHNSLRRMFLDLSGKLCFIFTYNPKLNTVHFHNKIILSHWHLLRRVVCHKMRPVRVTCIGALCTYHRDMRLPIPGKCSGCGSEFPICITTTINQGNSSVAPVLLTFVDDVFAKLKILHDYVIGETPKAMICLPSPLPWQDEGMSRCPSLGTRLCSCAFLIGSSYVHCSRSHMNARLTITLMCTVHCHTLQKYLSSKCHKIRKNHANDKMINDRLDRIWSEAVVT